MEMDCSTPPNEIYSNQPGECWKRSGLRLVVEDYERTLCRQYSRRGRLGFGNATSQPPFLQQCYINRKAALVLAIPFAYGGNEMWRDRDKRNNKLKTKNYIVVLQGTGRRDIGNGMDNRICVWIDGMTGST